MCRRVKRVIGRGSDSSGSPVRGLGLCWNRPDKAPGRGKYGSPEDLEALRGIHKEIRSKYESGEWSVDEFGVIDFSSLT